MTGMLWNLQRRKGMSQSYTADGNDINVVELLPGLAVSCGITVGL